MALAQRARASRGASSQPAAGLLLRTKISSRLFDQARYRFAREPGVLTARADCHFAWKGAVPCVGASSTWTAMRLRLNRAATRHPVLLKVFQVG
jgi:hypothetical protein